jgi:hypothetical protein
MGDVKAVLLVVEKPPSVFLVGEMERHSGDSGTESAGFVGEVTALSPPALVSVLIACSVSSPDTETTGATEVPSTGDVGELGWV